jgi:hypothetical protein
VGHEKNFDWLGESHSMKMRDYETYLIHDYTKSKRIIFSFAGGPQNQFQFRTILSKTGHSFVLFRDMTQQYYLNGIVGLGNQEAVLNYIRDFIRHDYHVMTIGVSSGAYAALFYGQLVPVDEVIVFSALTGRDGCDDFDQSVQHRIVDPNTRVPDLRPYFKNGPIPKVKSFISDGHGCDLDRQMVERLGVTDINLVPGFIHGELARGMRNKGMMQEIFK